MPIPPSDKVAGDAGHVTDHNSITTEMTAQAATIASHTSSIATNAADIVAAQAAVDAVEAELGTNPSGTDATVVARLDAITTDLIDPAIATHVTDQSHITTSATMTVAQPVEVREAGTLIGTRKVLNFISGTDATVDVVDNSGAGRVDVTVSALTGTAAPTARRERVFSFSGDAAAARQSQYVTVYQPETLRAVKVSCTVAPTGADVIVDVLKGGSVAEASIFTERPVLRAGETTAARSVSSSLNPGDTIRVEIDQAGSTVAGENITVTLVLDVTSSTYLDELVNPCSGDAIVDEDAVSTANSGGGSVDAWDAVTTSGSGAIVYDSDAARIPASHAFVHRVTTGVSSDASVGWTFADASEIFGRAYFQIDALPSTTARLVRVRDSSSVLKGAIALTTTGQLQLLNSAGTSIDGTGALITVDTWFRVEFRFVGGPNGRAQLWYYATADSDTPTEVLEASSASLGTVYGSVQVGRAGTGGSSGALTHWQHSIALSTRGKLGKI